MGREKGQRDSTEGFILSTWLLKFCFAEVTLWGAFTWDTNIFTFFAHSEKSVHIPPTQTFLSSIFHSCYFQVRALRVILLIIFFFPSKMNKVHCLNFSACWKDFSLPLSFRDSSERDCSVASVYFGVVPAHSAEPCINQAQVFLSQSTYCRKLLMRP